MKTKQTRIWKNYLYNVLYKGLSLLLPIATAPYLARVIGARGVGIYAFQVTISTYFIMFAKSGIMNHGVRTVAEVQGNREKLSRVFWELWLQQCISSGIAIIVYGFYILFFAGEYRNIALCLFISVIGAVLDINWFWNGVEEFRKIVFRNCIIKFVTVLGIFLFVHSRDDIWKYALVYAANLFAANLSFWFGIRKYIDFREIRKVSKRRIFSHLQKSAILFVPILATSVYRYMDKLMLGALSSMEEIGLYENAEKIIYSLIEFIPLLGTVMLPRMTSIFANGNTQKGREYLLLSLKAMLCLSAAMAFGIAAVSPEFVPWFYGDEFDGTILLLQLLAVTIVLIAWTTVIRTQYLIPLKKDHVYIVTVAAGAIVNIVINTIMIPGEGAKGACIGTIAAESTVLAVQVLFLYRELPLFSWFTRCLKFLISGAVMFFSVRITAEMLSEKWGIYGGIKALIPEVIAGAVVYFVLIILFMLVTDRKGLKNILNFLKNLKFR